jgi:hypothetical protein
MLIFELAAVTKSDSVIDQSHFENLHEAYCMCVLAGCLKTVGSTNNNNNNEYVYSPQGQKDKNKKKSTQNKNTTVKYT